MSLKAIKKEGAVAFKRGKDIDSCPYFQCTEEYDAWIDGWLEASEQYE